MDMAPFERLQIKFENAFEIKLRPKRMVFINAPEYPH